MVLLFIVVVQFLTGSSSAIESDGLISFTITSSVASDRPFTVQVCTREIVPLSAEGLSKCLIIIQIVYVLYNYSYTAYLLCF